MSGTGIGQLIYSPLIQVMIDNFSLGHTFIIFGATISIGVVSVAVIYYEASRFQGVTKEKENTSSIGIYKEIMKSPDVLIMLFFLGKNGMKLKFLQFESHFTPLLSHLTLPSFVCHASLHHLPCQK